MRENQRRRILWAALETFGDRGFAATTVQDLLRSAQVSRATFYELFSDKEACMAALHEDVLAWLRAEVASAVEESSDWPARVRAVIARLIELLAAEPRLAAVCLIEAPAGPPAVREQHERAVEEACELLRVGRAGSPNGEELPQVLEWALVCGGSYLIGRSLVHGQGPSPDALAAELPDLMLRPYLA